ncbi:MAG: sugar phosphate isomerase/epimerase [Acidobacteriia bacterium]|nr:sugar phosphate isomerase/epimerase [Terriglobia bacterium]
MGINRRQFLAASAVTAAAQTRSGSLPFPKPRTTPPICLYSQAVIKIEYADLGPILSGMGFDGCNLSVQDGGHVAPNQASLDLVRAVEALRGAGVDVPVITTALTAADDPDSREVLGIGGILKVPLFRPGRWKYGGGDVMARLAEVRRDIATLGGLGRAAGMAMAIHNQPGGNVGQAIWDTDAMIRGMDPQAVGYDFDAGFAAAAGEDGWTLALRLALPRLKMITAHDFYWARGEGGRWKMTPCPLGEGMVDWPRLFAALARAGFRGPVSLEIDYESKNEVPAIQRDLEFLKKQVAAAYSTHQ